jgi:hypothetical protein
MTGIFQAGQIGLGQTAHDQGLCPTTTSITRPIVFELVSYTIIIYKRVKSISGP